ncbi:MAG: redox-sensing transcriptional repressor Rex [Chitinispirillaceae bacterium]|nr:redox-sensing transcriptional repressor Rex [Chitinispirillaceae bacterium]
MKSIPFPTLQRLCTLFQILTDLKKNTHLQTSSLELAALCGTTAFTIRKDIATLGVTGNSGQGYAVEKLMQLIGNSLGFFEKKRIGVIGIGSLGSALIKHSGFNNNEFEVVAAFDSNINKIETTKAVVPLFPFYQLSSVVNRLKIDYGLLAVPPDAAQGVTDKLVESGIKGIINFAPIIVKSTDNTIFIRNVDMAAELRILTAQNYVKSIEHLHQ